jgi:hypothetical protein
MLSRRQLQGFVGWRRSFPNTSVVISMSKTISQRLQGLIRTTSHDAIFVRYATPDIKYILHSHRLVIEAVPLVRIIDLDCATNLEPIDKIKLPMLATNRTLI